MAENYLNAEQAAKVLGISTDELGRLRERNKISGYRDGSSWKFREQAVQRLAQDLASGAFADESGVLGAMMPEPADKAGQSDVVLLSEVELGGADPSISSTVIGKSPRMKASPASSDSDVVLVPETGRKPDSDVKLVAADSSGRLKDKPSSDVELGDDMDLVDLTIDDSRDGSSLPLDLGSGMGSGMGKGGSSLVLADSKNPATGGSSLVLGGSALKPGESSLVTMAGGKLNLEKQPEKSSDISLGSDANVDSLALGSDIGKVKPPSGKGSDIELGSGSFEDDELVLGSLSGSDLSINPSESGISLSDPSDSGLSLEEPLELGSDEPTEFSEVSGDDEFLLTPTVDSTEDDAESSGSQVIALDTEGDFDDAAATMLGEDVPGMAGMLEAEPIDLLGTPGGGASPVSPMGDAVPTQFVVAKEAPYSIWNVMGLSACLMVLTVSGMMMYDVLRNMWSWGTPYSTNSWLMNTVTDLLPK